MLRNKLQKELRTKFEDMDRSSIKEIQNIRIYTDYYKRFKKTYHVPLQLESVAHKRKDIPAAGHDLSKISLPITVHIASEIESYTTIGGKECSIKKGDMFMADENRIISSIIYGPDERTQVTPHTTDALYTVYAPPGITERSVQKHLCYIKGMVRNLSPGRRSENIQILSCEPQ